jgi:putative phage-type endonuclease
MPKIMHVEQGSKEWLDMKFTHFGGSYAPIIMGISSHCTPHQLWNKMMFKEHTPSNRAMDRGKSLEQEARKKYEMSKGVTLVTPVIQHDLISLAIVSLDGCRVHPIAWFDHVIEIKCYGQEKHRDTCTMKIIPEEALWQCVHICWVLNRSSMTYISYNPDYKECDYCEVPFFRDEELEKKYLAKLSEFMEFVSEYKEPPRTDKDYYDATNNPKWLELENNYISLNKTIKELEEMRETLRERMIDEANGMSVVGNKVRMTRVTNRGRIRYESIPELKGIDLEPYRGTNYITNRISELK